MEMEGPFWWPTSYIKDRQQEAELLSGMLLSSLDIDGTLTCYISNKRSLFSPFDYICYNMINPNSQKMLWGILK